MARVVDPLEHLKRLVSQYPTQAAAARALEISQPYLTDLLYGRRRFSERMLAKLGLGRTIRIGPTAKGAA